MARHPTPPGSPRARSSRLLFFASAVLAALVVTQPWRPDPSRASRMLLEEEELPGASRQRAGSATVALDAAAAAAAVQLASAAAAAASSSSSSSSSVQAAQQQQQQGGLQGRAACVAAATTGPVPVHGWVKKAGPLPMHLLDGPVTPQRHQAYFRWRDARDDSKRTQQALVDGRLERVGRAPPLFPYCRILVNHAYRTLYLKAPKTGSTSLLTLLGTCTGDAETDKPTCFQALQTTGMTRGEYEAMYRDYFVWSVVRNPWARAVSSYRMLSRYTKRACKDLMGGWDTVCRDFNHIGRLHNEHPECTMSKAEGEGFAMHHIIAQAPCMVTDGGEWAADYVVRTERLQEDMQAVLQEMNARRHLGVPEIDVPATLAGLTNVNKVHVACKGPTPGTAAADQSSRRQLLARPLHLEAPESYCSEAQYFLQPHSACFDALRSYYSHDMRLFGLPSCLDGAAAAADAAAAGVSAAQAAAAADDDDDAAAAAAEAEAAAVAGGEAEFAVEVADAQDDSALLSEAEAAGALLDAAEAEDAAVADE